MVTTATVAEDEPRVCKRCGHIESAHDDIDGCQVVFGAVPGFLRMEACDCECFVPMGEED